MARASVIIPVFNRAKLLRECLDSVAAQSVKEWECIVVDDGSSDDSPAVAAAYAARDERFRALSRPALVKGASACRNHGLAASTAPYVMFLDSDDLLHPECLERRLKFMRTEGEIADLGIFPTLTFYERPGDRDILWNVDKPTPDLLRFLRLDVAWSTAGAFWRSEAIRSIGGFDENLPGWQDWQVHIVALLEGLNCVRAGGPADSYWRDHGGEQISKGAGTLAHVVPKSNFLIRLMEKYVITLQADPLLRPAAAGLMWRQVVHLDCLGRKTQAMSFWRCVWRLGYVSFNVWLEGAVALLLHGQPGGRLVWSRVARWPSNIVGSIDRSTCQVVSLADISRF